MGGLMLSAAQIHFGEALQRLHDSVCQSAEKYAAYSSGLLRFEVCLDTAAEAMPSILY